MMRGDRREMGMGGEVGDGVRTMRSASALRFSKGCSSLNLDRILTMLMIYLLELCVL